MKFEQEVIKDEGSFRDPCGQVYKILNEQNTQIIRGVNSSTYEEQAILLETNFFQSLLKTKKVVTTNIFDKKLILDKKVASEWPFFLSHSVVNFISYPYEWTFGQLKDAAILHLELLKDSLNNGWIIKDSSPYNIQFLNNQPIFIDTPSFKKWKSGAGWDSYRQFCMMFLYPLMLEAYLDIDFRPLMKSNLDGIDSKYLYKSLGALDTLRKGVISHVLFPYFIEKNILKKEKDNAPAKIRNQIHHSRISVIALVDSMLSIVKSLSLNANISAWADYDHINTYKKKDNDIKKDFLKKVTLNNNYQTVWDFGSNTGLFSDYISNNVNNIIAMDSDSIAVEKMYQRLKMQDSNINPLVMRLENMSPDHGFNALERVKLERRSQPNLVICLALIHHIRINSNIPCKNFLQYLRSLNSDVIIEFVNRDDEMVIKLLTNKDEKYEDYNLQSFELEASNFFNIIDTAIIKDGRRKFFFMIPK